MSFYSSQTLVVHFEDIVIHPLIAINKQFTAFYHQVPNLVFEWYHEANVPKRNVWAQNKN